LHSSKNYVNVWTIDYNTMNIYLSCSKNCRAVVSGTTSVCGLQHNSSSEEATNQNLHNPENPDKG